ncbi:hypothetical protein OBBRIDRAFT_248417 [Obba rivulosa]|uniref:Uncharacterized protein n=1 Tax=Obba rivulosa TaxID=1052685 RepID=A0A8E2AQS8_9APHY|nr:hypothetical protein OBBRIDRAFT_248417 [Obba rivulosa]
MEFRHLNEVQHATASWEDLQYVAGPVYSIWALALPFRVQHLALVVDSKLDWQRLWSVVREIDTSRNTLDLKLLLPDPRTHPDFLGKLFEIMAASKVSHIALRFQSWMSADFSIDYLTSALTTIAQSSFITYLELDLSPALSNNRAGLEFINASHSLKMRLRECVAQEILAKAPSLRQLLFTTSMRKSMLWTKPQEDRDVLVMTILSPQECGKFRDTEGMMTV